MFIFKLLCFDVKIIVAFFFSSFPGCAMNLTEAALPLPTHTHFMKQGPPSESESSSARKGVILFCANPWAYYCVKKRPSLETIKSYLNSVYVIRFQDLSQRYPSVYC